MSSKLRKDQLFLGIVLETGSRYYWYFSDFVHKIAHFGYNSATVCILIHRQLSAPIWKSSPNNFYAYAQNHCSPSTSWCHWDTTKETRGARRNFLRWGWNFEKNILLWLSTGYLIYYNIYVIYVILILTHQHFSWPGPATTSVFPSRFSPLPWFC